MLITSAAARPAAERAFGPAAERAFGPGPVLAWLEHRRAQLPGGSAGSTPAPAPRAGTGRPQPR